MGDKADFSNYRGISILPTDFSNYRGISILPTDFGNYRGTSILPTTYKIVSKILLPRLTPYAEEITGDRQCGFGRSRSTTHHIFCIRQILEKKKRIQ